MARPRRLGPAPKSVSPELVYGRNAVLEAARAGRVRRAMVAEGVGPDARLEELGRLVAIERVPSRRLEEMVDGVHQGVVAMVASRTYLTLKELIGHRPDLLVGLDGIMDPHNLGAILRSAEAAGAQGAVLPERRCSPLTGVAVKASSGATEHLLMCRVGGLASALAELERAGLWCVALDPRGELLPWEFDFRSPVCLVVGAEGGGVHRLVGDRCQARVRLPMAGRVASLNVAAAAAVMLFEVVRQRRAEAHSA